MASVTDEKHGFDSFQTPRLRRSYSLPRVAATFILACLAVIAGLQWHPRFRSVIGPSVKHPEADKPFNWDDVRL